MIPQTPATEIHLTPQQISALWGLDESTVREVFRNETGVLRYSAGEKRRRETIRVPLSVVERVHRKLSE